MRTIIEGFYENGQILLARQPKLNVKAKVTVIFVEIIDSQPVNQKRPFGISKGAFEISPDFDDPLESADIVSTDQKFIYYSNRVNIIW